MKTPKEKALELCQKFGWLGTKWEQTNYVSLDLANAKQCAIICVEECHKAAFLTASPMPEKTGAFWTEVKEEINNLL